MGTGRTDDLEVADDRGAYGRYQRIRDGVSRFGAWRPDQVLVPIEMVELQLGDFPSTPAIEGEEHEDRTVADVPWLIGIEGAQEVVHLLPGGPCRESGLRKDTRSLDGLRDSGPAPTLDPSIAEENA
jgi:hypothetical protein